jgi:site-specific recombinase XerD/RNA polymerase subunit RPABC4/transcription elongation factor Spt4
MSNKFKLHVNDKNKGGSIMKLGNERPVNRGRLTVERFIKRFYECDSKQLLPQQAEAILAFDKEIMVNDLSLMTRRNYIRHLKKLAETIRKPFKEMTKEDLEFYMGKLNQEFSANTAQVIKIQIKRFFKFVYKTDEFPEVVKWISIKKSKRHREPTKKIITFEERKAMLTACKNQRDRALLQFLDNTGCRAEELLLTTIADIEPDEHGRYMTVTLGRGKTGRRRILITDGISDIQLWINMHPLKNDPNATLFISLSYRNKSQPLRPSGLNEIISRLAENAGITRNIYPHLFRHTRATICGKIKKWNEARMRIFFGWTKNSNMPSVYTHMNDDDVNELALLEAGIKKGNDVKETELKDKACPRCHKMNPFDAKYCNFCSLLLDSSIAGKHAKIVEITDKVMDIGQDQNLNMEKAVEKYLDEIRTKLMADSACNMR